MGYSYKSIKSELTEKNYANEGLVAIGQRHSSAGLWFGAIGAAINSASSNKYAFILVEGSKLAIIPFTNKEIKYAEAKAFDKSKFEILKVSGWIGKQLTIKLVGGQKVVYDIMGGPGDIKEIVNRMGF